MIAEGRRLEASISGKLHELSELNRRLSQQEEQAADGVTPDVGDAEDPVGARVGAVQQSAEGLLAELDELVGRYDQQQEALTASQRVLLQGLRDVHRRESTELRRLAASTKHKLDNAQLMANVWKNGRGDHSDVEHLLRERNSIHNSSSMIEQSLQQAEETRLALDRQKKMLLKGSSNLDQLLGMFPAANNFINKIRNKKNRDQLILASVIAACLLFCVWWEIGRAHV